MLRLTPEHPLDTVWDSLLPVEVRVLPEMWARWDEWLRDPLLLQSFVADGWCRPAGRHAARMAPLLED